MLRLSYAAIVRELIIVDNKQLVASHICDLLEAHDGWTTQPKHAGVYLSKLQ
jgi:hypothetical protein